MNEARELRVIMWKERMAFPCYIQYRGWIGTSVEL